MLVTNRVSGPSYSTDHTARRLASFTNRRTELPEHRESPRAASPTPSLEELYPTWFVAEATTVGFFEHIRLPRAMREASVPAKLAVAIALVTGAVGSSIVAFTR